MKQNLYSLPKNWKWAKLGDVATLNNGKAYKKHELLNQGPVPVIRVGNFFSNRSWYYSDLQLPENKYCGNGDLLYAWSASFGPKIWDGGRAIYHYHIWKIDTSEFIEKKYLYYLLLQDSKDIKSKGNGIAMMHATKGGMEVRQIPLPPLNQQKKIAAILDAADAYRQKTKALIAKYDELTQSLFLDMFGDPVVNPKNWEKVPTITYCDCIVPGRDKPKSFTGNIPWVTTSDLNHLSYTKKSKSNIGLTSDEIAQVRAKLITKKSVIMTCVGDLGIVSINTEDIVMNQQLHAFICHARINNVFLMHNLSYQTPYMNKMASNTTVSYMNKTVANNTPTIVPPINLQYQFAERVQAIETQKQYAQDSLEKSEDLFNCLLQKAFKGELTEENNNEL